jgi:hypothetical protein
MYDEECIGHGSSLCELIDEEIEKQYDENYISGLIKAQEIIKEYFGIE